MKISGKTLWKTMPLDLIAVNHLWPSMQITPKSSLNQKKYSVKGHSFSLVSTYQVETASWLGIVSCVHVSSQWWNPISLGLNQVMCILTQYLWVHTCTHLAMFTRHFSLVSSISSSSYILFVFSSLRFH